MKPQHSRDQDIYTSLVSGLLFPLHERMKAQGDFEKARVAFIARQPMGRLAQADEIASLVVYLASDEAAFITGQTFTIDGGMSV